LGTEDEDEEGDSSNDVAVVVEEESDDSVGAVNGTNAGPSTTSSDASAGRGAMPMVVPDATGLYSQFECIMVAAAAAAGEQLPKPAKPCLERWLELDPNGEEPASTPLLDEDEEKEEKDEVEGVVVAVVVVVVVVEEDEEEGEEEEEDSISKGEGRASSTFPMSNLPTSGALLVPPKGMPWK
jgi:hypothetical protein